MLASGTTIKEIVADYPDFEEAGVLACIAYGAEIYTQAVATGLWYASSAQRLR